jgi:hypothetical protein
MGYRGHLALASALGVLMFGGWVGVAAAKLPSGSARADHACEVYAAVLDWGAPYTVERELLFAREEGLERQALINELRAAELGRLVDRVISSLREVGAAESMLVRYLTALTPAERASRDATGRIQVSNAVADAWSKAWHHVHSAVAKVRAQLPSCARALGKFG